jgi:glycogen debranching enzyme
MDSTESLFHEKGDSPIFPIAPVEVQAYAYLSLKLWGNYFGNKEFLDRADDLKDLFNKNYVKYNKRGFLMAYAIDGNGIKFFSPRSSIGHTLWASMRPELDGKLDSILDEEYVEPLVKRIMADDLFLKKAGIRTLSSRSKKYSPRSYHNGSIWPHDSSIIAEGLDAFGYYSEAKKIRKSIFNAITHFGSAVELYAFDRKFSEYEGGASKRQAWCAASLIADVAREKKNQSLTALV